MTQTAARIRFAIFVLAVLGPDAALMATGDPRLRDLGKLVMILSPAVAGALLAWGRGYSLREHRRGWVAGAALLTLIIALGASAAAMLAGAARFGDGAEPDAIALHTSVSALTSLLEEAGWSAGGLVLARAAFGDRWGVWGLGLVWAAWHLVPAGLHVGLFPELETAPPGMIAAFILSCLLYRDLLIRLRDRAGTWLAGAAGHAAPNILLAGMMADGFGGFSDPKAWPWFPAPGGLVFPVLVAVAIGWIVWRERAGRSA